MEAKKAALEKYDKTMESLFRGGRSLPCNGDVLLRNHKTAQCQSMEAFEVDTSSLLCTSVSKELEELMVRSYIHFIFATFFQAMYYLALSH